MTRGEKQKVQNMLKVVRACKDDVYCDGVDRLALSAWEKALEWVLCRLSLDKSRTK